MTDHTLVHPRRTIAFVGVALTLVAGAVISTKVAEAIRIGPGWDTYALLCNAAHFAGDSVGYVEMHRPPVMPFLTSLVFRAGLTEVAVIQWIDGALSLLAVLALYAVMTRRFNPLAAAVGAFAMLGLPALWTYLGTGYTDFPSMGIGLWSLFFLVKATDDHPGWYLAAIPLLIAAWLTRYGTLVFGVPALGLLFLRSRPFRHWKLMLLGALGGLAVFVPAAVNYWQYLGDALAPFVSAFSAGTTTAAEAGTERAVGLSSGYLINLVGLLMPAGGGIAAILVLGVSGLGYVSSAIASARGLTGRRRRAVLSALAITAAVAAQLTMGAGARQVTLLVAVLVTVLSFAPRDETGRVEPGIALDATMLLLLLAYLDAHGHMFVKLGRYFIAMAPGLIYLVLLGWRLWLKEVAGQAVQRRGTHRKTAGTLYRSVAFGMWSLLSVLLAVGVVLNLLSEPAKADALVAGARDTAAWLLENEEQIEERTLYSDLWPLTSWYLGQEAYPMPAFKEEAAFAHDLEKNEVDYYVTIRSRRFEGYTEVAAKGPVRVLKRVDAIVEHKPRIKLLGDGWDNYLESVVDYEIELVFPAGRVERGRSRRIDSATMEELQRYDAVGVFQAAWYDRAAAENLLRGYVESGGTLIIDASANLGDLGTSLADTVFLDTVIRRADVPPDAEIHVMPKLLAIDPSLARIEASPFVDETGGAWYGAAYSTIEGLTHAETLATVGGQSAVVRQELGDGVIYWFGSNLVWHAFITEDADEAALVRAVILAALSEESSTGLR